MLLMYAVWCFPQEDRLMLHLIFLGLFLDFFMQWSSTVLFPLCYRLCTTVTPPWSLHRNLSSRTVNMRPSLSSTMPCRSAVMTSRPFQGQRNQGQRWGVNKPMNFHLKFRYLDWSDYIISVKIDDLIFISQWTMNMWELLPVVCYN